MAVHIGANTITEVSQNGHNIMEVSGNYAAYERCNARGGRSTGDSGTAVEYSFNVVSNSNNDTGGLSGARFTAPYDGTYWIYFWFMIRNTTTQNNKRYRIRINNSSDTRQVYVYTSNGGGYYREAQSGICVNLSAGDFVSVYTDTMNLYGSSTLYSRINATFLG